MRGAAFSGPLLSESIKPKQPRMKLSLPNPRLRGRSSAFTLFEMILVLAIIAILIGLGIYHLSGTEETANIVKAKADAKTLTTALTQYKVRHSRYPTESEGLKALVNGPDGSTLISQEALTDGWGTAYLYRNPARKKQGAAIEVFSAGPDRQPDSGDDVY